MLVGLKGEASRLQEFSKLLPSNHSYEEIKGTDLEKYDFIVDLNFDEDAALLPIYAQLEGTIVFASAVKKQLEAQVLSSVEELKCQLIGINALPGFIDRERLELCLHSTADQTKLKALAEELGWKYSVVKSRVGMVTPRVICMIINEAFYTVQEGTASKKDIDLSMKLGTAYPYGPFEWTHRIGIGNVYQVLDALYQDTREERYKICPLLKTEYLESLVKTAGQ